MVRMDDELITLKELADYLRVTVPTIKDYIKKGQIPVLKVSPRKWRIRKSDVAYLYGKDKNGYK